MIIEQIKFYADTSFNEKNKFFCFECPANLVYQKLLEYHSKGCKIRAAWFVITCPSIPSANLNLRLLTPEKYLQNLFLNHSKNGNFQPF